MGSTDSMEGLFLKYTANTNSILPYSPSKFHSNVQDCKMHDNRDTLNAARNRVHLAYLYTFAKSVYLHFIREFAYTQLNPSMHFANSSIRSTGKGGLPSGFKAIDISFRGLSSAALRLELMCPQILQR